MTALNWATISKTADADQLRIAVEQLDINQPDERGRTPLMLMITNRRPAELISLLLQQQPALEVSDKLGDTALIKAVNFKQYDLIPLLLQAGAKLDHPAGVLHSAWQEARTRHDLQATRLLSNTTGAVRLELTEQEQATVDTVVYQESVSAACQAAALLDDDVVLHAAAEQYNWDDSPAPMLIIARNPQCAWITLHTMYELLDSDYWLAMDEATLLQRDEGEPYKELAVLLQQKLAASRSQSS
ncbi:DUF4274 domain-containing protein [Paenibacillus sp. WLX2291]|uniref:DUF4274 domain-containing protein n=1 Tax=Paenibacillus sp. WLX2291 TaxID=3296934 RepID=UPI003983E64C